MSGLLWSSEAPTQPGWYWYTSETRKPVIGEVLKFRCDYLHLRDEHNRYVPIHDCDLITAWAGPIPEPEGMP